MLSSIVFLAVVSSAFTTEVKPNSSPVLTFAAPFPVYSSIPVGSSQYRVQDVNGQYSFGYATENGINRNEVRGIDGSVVGGYSYTSPEGQQVRITYTSGEDGFRASGDAIPKQVEPTSEVAEATKSHLDAKSEAERHEENDAKVESDVEDRQRVAVPIAHVAAPVVAPVAVAPVANSFSYASSGNPTAFVSVENQASFTPLPYVFSHPLRGQAFSYVASSPQVKVVHVDPKHSQQLFYIPLV